MTSPLRWSTSLVMVILFVPFSSAATDAVPGKAPMPRPRLTEALRAKTEDFSSKTEANGAVNMDKVIVHGSRLPSGPPKEEQREGEFSITQGGYILKDRGEKFSTEVGLWRHVSILPSPSDSTQQGARVRMGVLRISW